MNSNNTTLLACARVVICYELAEHRKMIKLILDKLGITDEELEAYYKEVEKIKTNVREQNKMSK